MAPISSSSLSLSNIYGVPYGQATNTSVQVQFSGPPGFPIPVGFTISDGNNQYVIPDGGIIASNGVSPLLSAIAVLPGSWPVPPATVINIISSVPAALSPPLTVTNPYAGFPGTGSQTPGQFRAAVLQAGLAASEGMARYMKTLLGNISGVQARLVSVRQIIASGPPTYAITGGWEVICGGADQYEVANAIWQSLFDINTLVGSTLQVTGITNGSPGQVTTNILDHGYAIGQVVNIAGVIGMIGINNTPFTITVISEKVFSIGVYTTSYGTYQSGGVVTPNLRNVVVTINDYPDNYAIPYVVPPQQTVAVVCTWNTTEDNFVSEAAVAQLGNPAIVNYINSVSVGQPINLLELDEVFKIAIKPVLPSPLLTRLVWAISINGIGTSPVSGTKTIFGDPESSFSSELLWCPDLAGLSRVRSLERPHRRVRDRPQRDRRPRPLRAAADHHPEDDPGVPLSGILR